MLLKRRDLAGIKAEAVDLVFRRWKRPTVKAGGSLRTAIGVLAVEAVDRIDESDISGDDARRAGFDSLRELLDELRSRRAGELYRIKVRLAGADPRIELRERSALTADEVAEIGRRLRRFDSFSRKGPWTITTLQLIAEEPETRAADLAHRAGFEKTWFKTNVRKLKELGLTESMGTGYRLSPRGRAYLQGTED